MDLKKVNAPVNTETYNRNKIDAPTENIYEAISVIARRAEQINTEIRKELIDKLEEFATYNDSLEEIFENKEQIEVSKFYEKLPKPHALAVQEWLNDKIYYRNTEQDSQEYLGITAGIAAYKTASLVRLFIKAGAHVKVVMTPASKDFITPLTLSTLSKNPVVSSFTNDENENDVWNNHVALGLWADLFLIAPATANTLSKMAFGNSDNMLLATYLSAKCPIYFAPAMDLDMYKHTSTKNSLEILKSFGNVMIPATSGELASGLVGEGRMAEPEEIVSFIENHILSGLPLHKKC